MATLDLLNELQKETFKADGDLERKVCHVVLNQLDDTSGDISGLAVKCLGLLVRKVNEARGEEVVRSLCERVTSGKKEQQRDIASIGLKTVVGELSTGAIATNASALITANMLLGASNKDNYEVVSDSLEILTDVVTKFGGIITTDHPRIQDCLLANLDDGRAPVRKRALQCLAALSGYLTDDLLNEVAEHLLAKLGSISGKPDCTRTYVQAIGQISRAVGYRFGKHLPKAIHVIIQHCDQAGENDDELRENCIQALESFVLRCSLAAKPNLDQLLSTTLKYLKFDPNFADDMEDDAAGGDDEDEDIESDEEYSDDEDMSWKVRRASAKCVSAIISHYPEALQELYPKVSSELVAGFREREENVKSDLFHAYVTLLQQVASSSSRFDAADASSPRSLLTRDVGAVTRSLARQLKEKSLKTRSGAFLVLKELVVVLGSTMADQIPSLMPGILAALNDKSTNSSLKIEALVFLRLAIASTPPAVFQPSIKQLTAGVFVCVNERYYKVTSEALRVCEQMIDVIRPSPLAPLDPSLKQVVAELFSQVMRRLSAQDQDQEVKEWAILCMAATIASLADELAPEVPSVLRVLLDKLRNEITRLTAVKAISVICATPLMVDMSPVMESVLAELTSFLRKANRQLRQVSLQALEALASKYSGVLSPTEPCLYVDEAASLVSDTDLSLTALTLSFICTLLQKQHGFAPLVVAKVLPHAMSLVQSPLLQGAVLDALHSFFLALAASGAPQATHEVLLRMLMEVGQSGSAAATRQSQHSIASCMAALCSKAACSSVQATLEALLARLTTCTDPAIQRLVLLCIGEIGRSCALPSHPAVEPQLRAALQHSLEQGSEDIRGTAALALGAITCGALQHYLPPLLQLIAASQTNPKRQYLLLQALNEVIVTNTSSAGSAAAFSKDQQESVLVLLLKACEGEEECRNVAAECLGRLALLHPAPVLSALVSRVNVPSANVRCCVVAAVKYAVVDKPHAIDEALSGSCLMGFLMMMADPDRHVRKAAVVSLSALARHKPRLVLPHLAQLLPLLYQQTAIREDMIRTVDLGPFKHKIDDGLELRKAAFECLDLLLDTCSEALDPQLFLVHLESGLNDHYDVKVPCHLMLSKLAAANAGAVLSRLERLLEPLEKTLTTKLKGDAVKQEVDRQEDLVRSCLRAVESLSHLPGIDACAPFQAFMRRTVLGQPALKEKYLALEKEKADAEGPVPMER